MENKRNMWVWIGVAVVVVVAVAAVVVWFVQRGQGPNGPVPVHAPIGQVVEGFPQQLILGAATSSQVTTSGVEKFIAGITNSYSINYSSSTNQYTSEWVSSSTPAVLYAQYNNYVTTNGWTIANHADTPSLKAIYATNASSAINIVITPQSQSQSAAGTNKGSKVAVSYVSN